MYKVVLVLVWLKEVKEVVVVTVETDCHLGLEMVVVTVIARIWDGWTNTGRKCSAWFSEHHAPAAAATATTSKCVTECTGICEHDKPGCKWSRVSGAGMSTRKHARNARTGTSMVWCAMDSPTTNVYAADCASACT